MPTDVESGPAPGPRPHAEQFNAQDLFQLTRFFRILLEWDARQHTMALSQTCTGGTDDDESSNGIQAGRALRASLVEGSGT